MKKIILTALLMMFVSTGFSAEPANGPDAAQAATLQRLKDAIAQAQQVATQTAVGVAQTAPVAVIAEPSLSGQIRDGAVDAASVLITALLAVGLAWFKSHTNVMQSLLAQSVQTQATPLATTPAVFTPDVSVLANMLVSNFIKEAAIKIATPQAVAKPADPPAWHTPVVS